MTLFSNAVVASRAPGTADALDYFPTPPWATRAFVPILRELDPAIGSRVIWEPAAGQGHMAIPLSESGAIVVASDIELRAWAAAARDLLFARGGARIGLDVDFLSCRDVTVAADWVITNPPFNQAVEFVERGLDVANVGVAVLVRTAWVEGAIRYRRLFEPRPPAMIAQYVERVPMIKDRWDPDASTATAYAWFVWLKDKPAVETEFRWIPPGQKAKHHRADDVAIFCAPEPSQLFGDGEAAP